MEQIAFKLGMGQMLVEGARPQANLRRAEEMIAAAAQADCRVVVLPECLDLGWLDESAVELAEPIPGPRSERLAAAAKRHGVIVAAGLTERQGNQIYNAAVLIDESGRLLLKHRKINELRFGPPYDRYTTGRSLAVADTHLGYIGVNICADNFPESRCIGDALAQMGARIILSPCAWAVPADHDNAKTPYGSEWVEPYSKLAREHQIHVIGVSCVGRITSGPWTGRRCIGNSLAMGPDSRILRWGPHGDDARGLVIVPISITSAASASVDRRLP